MGGLKRLLKGSGNLSRGYTIKYLRWGSHVKSMGKSSTNFIKLW